MGHKTKNQYTTYDQRQEIYKLAESGMLQKDIAKVFGLTQGSVSRILVEAGIYRNWTKNVWRRAHE